MATLFVSDVHLSSTRPLIVAAFLDFLGGAARRAEALYVLGDLFDEWLGDDDTREPNPAVITGLAGLTKHGVPVYVMHGNHDFLLGESFSSQTGCHLLAEPHRLDLYGTKTLVMHGDSLCTRDVEYQAYRRYTRDPDNQRDFLALPFPQRMETAASIRHRSRGQMRIKTDDITDVSQEAVEEALTANAAQCLIHGHTHRPGMHQFTVGSRPARRIVLGDWYEQDSVLICDQQDCRLARIADF